MKTRIFTLYVTILVMATVTTATGQPERGERNGNHEKNNRSEITNATRNESRGNQNIRRDNTHSDRADLRQEMRVTDNVAVSRGSETRKPQNQSTDNSFRTGDRRSVSNTGHSVNNPGRLDENRNSAENRERVHQNPVERPNQNGYAGNYDNTDTHNRKYYGNDRHIWNNGNYSRNEWEHRKYNWNEYHWQFSHYYRKGYIPWYFRDNVNYWYYPEYGHILRGFRYEPLVLYSGLTRIYFSDGFFYRYYPGIGYVWVENPGEIWFTEIPYHMVSIRIHGKTYFRLGNAYFMTGRRGFRLAELPDRYYDPRYDRGPHFEISARF